MCNKSVIDEEGVLGKPLDPLVVQSSSCKLSFAIACFWIVWDEKSENYVVCDHFG